MDSPEITEVKAKEELRFDINSFLQPQRLENETYERYKERQKIVKMYLKERKKGQMWWMAKDIAGAVKGTTYNKQQYEKALELYNKHLKEKKKNEENNKAV